MPEKKDRLEEILRMCKICNYCGEQLVDVYQGKKSAWGLSCPECRPEAFGICPICDLPFEDCDCDR